MQVVKEHKKIVYKTKEIVMGRKILIVGGVAGGASTAARLRRQSEEDKIIMFEMGPHVSFSNCSLPYLLSGTIEQADDLVLMNPELFLKQYNIEARVNQKVVSLDRTAKTVQIKNMKTDELYEEHYDKLVLSPGAYPIIPKMEGLDQIPYFGVRNVVDIDKLHRFVKDLDEKKVTVIGGGFIGIEVAENLKEAGFEVTLIEAMDQILRPFDYDMVQILHKELHDHGIQLILSDKVEKFSKNQVHLASGKVIDTRAVVMAIGVAPETKLAVEAGLTIGSTGAIFTDKNYRTDDPDIYAVGDAIEVYHQMSQMQTKLPLAGPALKQARIVADHINGKLTVNKGYIGSSAIRVFDYNGASTGLNEGMIKALGLKIPYQVARIILSDKVGIMPDANPMHVKLLFDSITGKVLGAQAIGKGDVTKRIDVIATAMKFNATVTDLKDLELSYAPPFSTGKDLVNYAGYVGENLLNHAYKQIPVTEIRTLVEEGALFIDVRETYEYEYGHIKGAINIPLSTLRDRIDEIPKDKNVYLHCRTGQRSYNAVLALQNLGYNNVYNVAGSFLGLSFYEYFNDVTTKREPIVTAYNFY